MPINYYNNIYILFKRKNTIVLLKHSPLVLLYELHPVWQENRIEKPLNNKCEPYLFEVSQYKHVNFKDYIFCSIDFFFFLSYV